MLKKILLSILSISLSISIIEVYEVSAHEKISTPMSNQSIEINNQPELNKEIKNMNIGYEYTDTTQMNKSNFVEKNTTFRVTDTIYATLNNTTLTFNGTGAIPDYSTNNKSPWNNYSNQIEKVIVNDGITAIGKQSFVEHYYLNEVILPDNITEIREASFYACYKLSKINVPKKLRLIGSGAFAQCYELTQFDLNNNIEEIADYAFQDTQISKSYIPASVKKISELAYLRAEIDSYIVDSLNKIYSSKDGIVFDKQFKQLLIYPANNVRTNYVIPSSVTSICKNSFSSNQYLKTVTIPTSLENIEDYAFYSSVALETITLPKSIESIGYGLFDSCKQLRNITINFTSSRLPYQFFKDCKNLDSVIFNGEINVFESQSFKNCTSITKLVLPKNTKEIRSYAFTNCTNLVNVELPESLELIEENAFYDCEKLSINIPKELENIGNDTYLKVERINIKGTFNYYKTKEVLDIVNNERRKAGIEPLIMNKNLFDASQIRGTEIVINFDHSRPTGLSCFTVSPLAHGENILAGANSAEEAMELWMNSPGHRSNILNSTFKSIGIACYEQDGISYWVQLFSRNKGNELTNIGTQRTDINTVKTRIGTVKYIFNPTFMKLTHKWEKNNLRVYARNLDWDYASYTIDPSTFQWSTSNPNIIKADNGIITAISSGTAEIILKNGQAKTLNYKVAVDLEFPFIDVYKEDWYYSVVKETYELGIMSGAKPTEFRPNALMTRGMVATVLYNMENKPQVNFKPIFGDVTANQYYSNAIIWASNNHIISGYNNGDFGPNDNITREQMAVMLHNYMKYKGIDTSKKADLSKYSDSHEISGYANNAMKWAVGNNVMDGTKERKLKPLSNATRAECAKMILQAYKLSH